VRIGLRVNGSDHEIDVDPGRSLASVLRDDLALTGTRLGCGAGLCGACTVLIDGGAARACVASIGGLGGHTITTIEGLARDGALHPVQQAFVAEQVPQCGFCMSGQVMAAVALLSRTPRPSDADIREAMAGNLCRCGAYVRIRRAIRRAASS